MASRLKTLDRTDRISDQKSRLNQLIDIISTDINQDINRRTYSSFISGNTKPVTSSLFNTIYDQDHTLQSSNALFDMTFGIYAYTNIAQDGTTSIQGSTLVTANTINGVIDQSGKYNFDDSKSNMMREKINIYRQYAQSLLGNANEVFRTPHNASSTDDTTKINEALFINIKRLFKRDNLSKGTFGMRFFNRTGFATSVQSGAGGDLAGDLFTAPGPTTTNANTTVDNRRVLGRSGLGSNPNLNPSLNQVTLLDTNASINYSVHPVSGEYATLKLFLDSLEPIDCGLIFYDAGVIILDVNKIFNLSDVISGVISFPDAVASTNTVFFRRNGNDNAQNFNQVAYAIPAGKKPLGYFNTSNINDPNDPVNENTLSHFLQQATIDEIIKHFCVSRFNVDTNTALTFQNETIINSTIFFCRASPSEFNYSTNPTYTDSDGKILIVDNTTDQPFSYITTVGLYDNLGSLLAVAKLSRPIEKNPNNELTIRVRLDY